jgi:Fe2+ or Zn2+ uptake regulation protein
MNTASFFAALDSDLRREVLTVLADKPSTVLGVMQKLKNKGLDVKYRETVYRSLETLLDAGLVEKFYDREHGLCYKLCSSKIVVEIKSGLISVIAAT